MKCVLLVLCFFYSLGLVALHDASTKCVIELWCEECLPDNMPLVVSPAAAPADGEGADGRWEVVLAAGDTLRLSCGADGRLAGWGRADLALTCVGGTRYKHPPTNTTVALHDLGCQEDVFQDVEHEVAFCAPPLRGRAWQVARADGAPPHHVAALCYDEDRAAPTAARLALRRPLLPPHTHAAAPLSLFAHMHRAFETDTRRLAERLLLDEARLHRTLASVLRAHRVPTAGLQGAAAALLPPAYFAGQEARAALFVTGRVPSWRSVVAGNLLHAQRDVAALVRRARAAGTALSVAAGASGTATVRGAGGAVPLRLGGARLPVPRYLWTLVVTGRRALALVVLNDPLVAVSEVRAAVLCDSACGAVGWARELRRQRRFETPAYGLTFCCDAHELAERLPELPRDLLADVPRGPAGRLLDYEG